MVDGKGTFLVHVVGCQNTTWQGTITWLEEKEKQYFRSALEMIKLMDTAIDESRSKDSSPGCEQKEAFYIHEKDSQETVKKTREVEIV